MKKELKMDGVIMVNRQYNAKRYSEEVDERVAEEHRVSRIEKAKRKLALSILGGAVMSLPLLYGMLFLVTLV